jgi:hypothetical protein
MVAHRIVREKRIMAFKSSSDRFKGDQKDEQGFSTFPLPFSYLTMLNEADGAEFSAGYTSDLQDFPSHSVGVGGPIGYPTSLPVGPNLASHKTRSGRSESEQGPTLNRSDRYESILGPK